VAALSNVEGESFVDVTMSKLNVAGRHRDCRFERVVFDGCVFRETAFYKCSFVDCVIRSPKIRSSVFEGCALSRVHIENARGNRLDIRGCDVIEVKVAGEITDLIFSVKGMSGMNTPGRVGQVFDVDLSGLRCDANISGVSVARMKVQLPPDHVGFADCRLLAERVLADLPPEDRCTDDQRMLRNAMESHIGGNRPLREEWDIIEVVTYGARFIEVFQPVYDRYRNASDHSTAAAE
jgi:hypothetical protein